MKSWESNMVGANKLRLTHRSHMWATEMSKSPCLALLVTLLTFNYNYIYLLFIILYWYIKICQKARFALPVVTLLTFTSLASRLFIGLTPIFVLENFATSLSKEKGLRRHEDNAIYWSLMATQSSEGLITTFTVSNQIFWTRTIADTVTDLDTVSHFSIGRLDQRSPSCKKITGPWSVPPL